MTTWVPEACTLPTVEQPLRVTEFDQLFATALRTQQRPSPTTLKWNLDPAAEVDARDLTARESACCTFFTFTFRPSDDALWLEVEVPPKYAEVLDALERQARNGTQPVPPDSEGPTA